MHRNAPSYFKAKEKQYLYQRLLQAEEAIVIKAGILLSMKKEETQAYRLVSREGTPRRRPKRA